MRTALVADLIMKDVDDGGGRERAQSVRDEDDWTENFGRQLGITRKSEAGDVHQTLLLILQQVDALIQTTWPPPLQDERVCRDIVQQATKDLSPAEVYATVQAGSTELRQSTVGPVQVHELPKVLRDKLDRRLTSDLRGVLNRWVEWDVPKLRARSKQATEDAEKARKVAATESPKTPDARRMEPKDKKPLYEPRAHY